ncbi:MAG: cob(I)yrinic acid a,c-diamide adenosyltransferase [Treponema sp.]|jgi:cob(I)alamin adenosyltransferase|nr:cob(I)yrinic acid a,c-diamide adenosyltransferase [Treponema sp.]
MSIVTKTGDDGHTDIIGGTRLPKDSPLIECLGTLDELNAFLGDAKVSLCDTHAIELITEIQKDLFSLMGIIAGTPVSAGGIYQSRLDQAVEKLEAEMPPLASFVVPGATVASAKLHIARAVCRRAERRLVGLDLCGETKTTAVPYINRLSDLLFLLAQKELP